MNRVKRSYVEVTPDIVGTMPACLILIENLIMGSSEPGEFEGLCVLLCCDAVGRYGTS